MSLIRNTHNRSFAEKAADIELYQHTVHFLAQFVVESQGVNVNEDVYFSFISMSSAPVSAESLLSDESLVGLRLFSVNGSINDNTGGEAFATSAFVGGDIFKDQDDAPNGVELDFLQIDSETGDFIGNKTLLTTLSAEQQALLPEGSVYSVEDEVKKL